jgi:hypothetical protein
VPTVADRREVSLSDPALPPTRQPYHAVLEASGPAAARLERRLVSVVRRAARTSVRTLLRAYRAAGHRPRRAALVVGSVIAPATIANDHIRAHALEGRLFRIVLEEALRSEGLACITVVERQAYALAARVLRRPERTLRREVTDLGRPLAGPWRAEEKTATLGAWMALGAPPTRRGRPGRRLSGMTVERHRSRAPSRLRRTGPLGRREGQDRPIRPHE